MAQEIAGLKEDPLILAHFAEAGAAVHLRNMIKRDTHIFHIDYAEEEKRMAIARNEAAHDSNWRTE